MLQAVRHRTRIASFRLHGNGSGGKSASLRHQVIPHGGKCCFERLFSHVRWKEFTPSSEFKESSHAAVGDIP